MLCESVILLNVFRLNDLVPYWFIQGTLTVGEDTVQLTSSL